MFTWNVEEMKLMKSKYSMGTKSVYFCESEVSQEDKIAFVDKMQNGNLSYLIELRQKFDNDKINMPKGNLGDVRTVSLKAWIKRNDYKSLLDNIFLYGKINLLGCKRYIHSDSFLNYKGMYDTHNNLIDEMFHRQLLECERMEKKYFLEHDKYSILKQQFKDYVNKYHTTFNVKISFSSTGFIGVYDNDHISGTREITMDELILLNSKFAELENFINSISSEINIVY